MLEQGRIIADCTVTRQLATLDSRLEYLVKMESGEEKLVQFSASPNWSRAQRQSFHEQVKALCALRVPAVGAPTRVSDQDGELFCLYPLAPGVALQHILTDERTVRATLELFRAIIDLLEQAHRQQTFTVLAACASFSVHQGLSAPLPGARLALRKRLTRGVNYDFLGRYLNGYGSV